MMLLSSHSSCSAPSSPASSAHDPPAPGAPAPRPPASTLRLYACLLLIGVAQICTHSNNRGLVEFCFRIHANICSTASYPDPFVDLPQKCSLKVFKQTILN